MSLTSDRPLRKNDYIFIPIVPKVTFLKGMIFCKTSEAQ